MTIAITGASGFIGKGLIKRLTDLSVPFLASSRREVVSAGLEIGTWRQIDFANMSSIRDFCAGAECVIHLAGPDAETARTNATDIAAFVQATSDLFVAASTARVKRFIFISTVHVYGDASDEANLEESDCLPTTSYGASRLQAEDALRELAGFHEMELVIVRLANAFGWNPDPNALSWRLFVNELVKSGFETGTLKVRGNPDSVRDFVPIEVVARALQTIACAPANENIAGTWNIGSGFNFTLAEMAERISESIARATGLTPRITFEDGDQTPPSKLKIDTAKARRAGFIGDVSVSNGVDALVAQMLKSEQASNAL